MQGWWLTLTFFLFESFTVTDLNDPPPLPSCFRSHGFYESRVLIILVSSFFLRSFFSVLSTVLARARGRVQGLPWHEMLFGNLSCVCRNPRLLHGRLDYDATHLPSSSESLTPRPFFVRVAATLNSCILEWVMSCLMWLIHMCDMPHSYILCQIRCQWIHVFREHESSKSHAWRDSFTFATCLIRMCATWLISTAPWLLDSAAPLFQIARSRSSSVLVSENTIVNTCGCWQKSKFWKYTCKKTYWKKCNFASQWFLFSLVVVLAHQKQMRAMQYCTPSRWKRALQF